MSVRKTKSEYRQDLNKIIRQVLLRWPPLSNLTSTDLKVFFSLKTDVLADQLVQRLRKYHILRYFDRTKKTAGGLVVTDYAQDQLDHRLKWEKEYGDRENKV